MVLARMLRRTECMAQPVPQLVLPTATPNHYPNPLSLPADRTAERKRRRKRVRVEGLYLEREPEPKLHALALLELIQDECPEKVGSFIPRSHLDRAYRELCDHEGWKALSWTAIARALGTLTSKKLLKRNGVRLWLMVCLRLRLSRGPGRLHGIAPGLPRGARVCHEQSVKSFKTLVGAGRFELPTPSPPDWKPCGNHCAIKLFLNA